MGGAVGSKGGEKDGRMEKVRVSRHWAGQRPKWAEEDEDEDGLADVIAKRQAAAGVGVDAAGGPDPVDARMARLAERRESGSPDRAAALARRRAMREAEVVEGSDSEQEEDDSDDEPQRRRPSDPGRRPAAAAVVEAAEEEDDIEDRRARARAKAKAREEEQLAAEESEDASDEESSEYETETESEDEQPAFGVRAIAKPVFVRKSERESILEREKQDEEADAREDAKIAAREDRKVETRQKITSEILKEQEGGGDEATDWEGMPDDDDEADEAALYEAWRIRELRRVKRDRDERAAAEKAAAEIERRRKMSDAEIAEEDKDAFKNTKEGMGGVERGFLQKYYHRGAFFQYVHKQSPSNSIARSGIKDASDSLLVPAGMSRKMARAWPSRCTSVTPAPPLGGRTSSTGQPFRSRCRSATSVWRGRSSGHTWRTQVRNFAQTLLLLRTHSVALF